MKKPKNTSTVNKTEDTWLDRIVKSPYIHLGLAILSIFLAINTLSDVFKIIAIIVAGFIVIIAIIKYTSSQETKERLEKESLKRYEQFKYAYQKRYEQIFKHLRDYQREYKEISALINLRKINTIDDLGDRFKNLCTKIEIIFKIILDSEISACVKRIETDSIMNRDVNSWEVKTLARGQINDGDRYENDAKAVLIKDNTDFRRITIDGDNFFSAPDLLALHKYNNTTKNFEEYYRSAIVVPIRINRDLTNIKPTNNTNFDYHILGFLCIDSVDTFNESEEFSLATHFLKSFADSLYHLLEDFLRHQLDKLE